MSDEDEEFFEAADLPEHLQRRGSILLIGGPFDGLAFDVAFLPDDVSEIIFRVPEYVSDSKPQEWLYKASSRRYLEASIEDCDGIERHPFVLATKPTKLMQRVQLQERTILMMADDRTHTWGMLERARETIERLRRDLRAEKSKASRLRLARQARATAARKPKR